MTTDDCPKKVAEVDIDILEDFLTLIKDKYPLVDKANYFLETQGVSGVNIGMANQRDVMSHLCTILEHPEMTHEEKVSQIAAAEEHLRRAIIESYQKGCTLKIGELKEILAEYKKRVLPLKGVDVAFTSAPSTALGLKLRILFHVLSHRPG